MRTIKILTALLMLCATVCKAGKITPVTDIIKAHPDSLGTYVGKYQSVQQKGTFYIYVVKVDGQLVAKAGWDGSKFKLKRLSGDAFMAEGVEWSVKFVRDKNNQTNEVVLQGTEHWSRVKN